LSSSILDISQKYLSLDNVNKVQKILDNLSYDLNSNEPCMYNYLKNILLLDQNMIPHFMVILSLQSPCKRINWVTLGATHEDVQQRLIRVVRDGSFLCSSQQSTLVDEVLLRFDFFF
jgi:hypothetical protein